jgi:drug/metabolite transporter (DMT)-like permease
MVVASFFFAIMGVCVKLGSAKFTSSELVFYRSLFGFIAIALYAMHRKMPFSSMHLRLHLSRSINGFIALMLFFYAITHMPLSTAVTLNYTSPIFLAVFVAFSMREQLNPKLVVSILCGFLGVVLLLNPEMHWSSLVAGGAGLVSGLLTGYVYLQLTVLGHMEEPAWRTVFYFSLVCVIGSVFWVMTGTFHHVTLADALLLAGMGICATIAQFAMTKAYHHGNCLVVGSLAYFTVVFACFFDIYLWNATLSALNWLAITMIICGGLLSVWFTANKPLVAPP